MRVKRCYIMWCLLLVFVACSRQQEPVIISEAAIEVVFNAKSSKYDAEEYQDTLSILIFKKGGKGGKYKMYPDIWRGDWIQNDETECYYQSILLNSGTYRFLMAQGFSKVASDDKVALGIDSIGEPLNSYDKNYYFYYPSAADATSALNRCETELLVDGSDPAFEFVNTEYSLLTGNTFSANRKISRLQGRVDFLVRRGKKVDGKISTIDEGTNNAEAMPNALKKIEIIHVKLSNVGSRWNINSQNFSNPASYTFSLQESGGDYAFSSFNSNTFIKDFANQESANYAKFDSTAYCQGPLLFPAPDEKDIHAMIEIVYKKPLPAKTINVDIPLRRNEVSLVIIWLLSESVGMEVGIEKEQLEYSDLTVGDDGFWN